MSGDPTNARLWANADVYVAFDLDTDDPANIDADFGAGWDLVGILDGDDGFVYGHELDKNNHFGWGGVLVKTGRSHDVFTVKFSALEDNDTTFRLRWPGSSRGGDLVIPRPEQIKIGFETTEGDTKHRIISSNYAEVDLDGDVTENEPDLAKLVFAANIFPDTSGDFPYPIFSEQLETAS